MSHCLQREHTGKALHIEMVFKNASQISFLMFYTFEVQVWNSNEMKTWLIFVFEKGKSRNLPKLKFSIFKWAYSLPNLYSLNFFEKCLTKLIKEFLQLYISALTDEQF